MINTYLLNEWMNEIYLYPQIFSISINVFAIQLFWCCVCVQFL